MTDSKAKTRPASRRAWLAIGWMLWFLPWSGCQAARADEARALNPAPSSPLDVSPGSPENAPPWLDEVRTQREAWEARRASAREFHEQRRRLNHPRGAAQQEAWEEDLRQRRAERQERIDQDREHFLNLGPGPLSMPPSAEIGGARDPANPASPPTDAPMFTPPGWNNLWYFRGF